VRDLNEGSTVEAMELEHYPGMTEKSLETIVAATRERWPGTEVLIVHRVGRLYPLDQIVLVATTSAHRGNAFASCEFVMDYLKTHAPFWKKEKTEQGERWVDARVTDDAALERWGLSSVNAEVKEP
jgi:molybdopterin synthase catalytic subunit